MADQLDSLKTGQTGGVVLLVNTPGGISQEYITAGSGKDLNNPYRDLTEQERHRLQAMVDDDYEIFVAEMAAGRKLDPQRIRNELGAGIFSARQAVNVGLADAVMGRDEFFRHAATAAGLEPDKTVVERVAEPTGLSSLLGAKRAWGPRCRCRRWGRRSWPPPACAVSRPRSPTREASPGSAGTPEDRLNPTPARGAAPRRCRGNARSRGSG